MPFPGLRAGPRKKSREVDGVRKRSKIHSRKEEKVLTPLLGPPEGTAFQLGLPNSSGESPEETIILQRYMINIHTQIEEFDRVVNRLEDDFDLLAAKGELTQNLKLHESGTLMTITYALKNIVNDELAYPSRNSIVVELNRIINVSQTKPVIKLAKAFDDYSGDYNNSMDNPLNSPTKYVDMHQRQRDLNRKLSRTEPDSKMEKIIHTALALETSQYSAPVFDELPRAMEELMRLNLHDGDRTSVSSILDSNHGMSAELNPNRITGFKSQKEVQDISAQAPIVKQKTRARSNTIHKMSSNRTDNKEDEDSISPGLQEEGRILFLPPFLSPTVSPGGSKESLLNSNRDLRSRKKQVLTNNFFQIRPVLGDDAEIDIATPIINGHKTPVSPKMVQNPHTQSEDHYSRGSTLKPPDEAKNLSLEKINQNGKLHWVKRTSDFKRTESLKNLETKDDPMSSKIISNKVQNAVNEQRTEEIFRKNLERVINENSVREIVKNKQNNSNIPPLPVADKNEGGKSDIRIPHPTKDTKSKGFFQQVQHVNLKSQETRANTPQISLHTQLVPQSALLNPPGLINETIPSSIDVSEQPKNINGNLLQNLMIEGNEDYPSFESGTNEAGNKKGIAKDVKAKTKKKDQQLKPHKIKNSNDEGSSNGLRPRNKSKSKNAGGVARIDLSLTGNEMAVGKDKKGQKKKMLGFTVKVYQRGFTEDQDSAN